MYIDTRDLRDVFDRDLVTFEEYTDKLLDLKTELDRLQEKNEELRDELHELREEKIRDFEANPYMNLGISRDDFI